MIDRVGRNTKDVRSEGKKMSALISLLDSRQDIYINPYLLLSGIDLPPTNQLPRHFTPPAAERRIATMAYCTRPHLHRSCGPTMPASPLFPLSVRKYIFIRDTTSPRCRSSRWYDAGFLDVVAISVLRSSQSGRAY